MTPLGVLGLWFIGALMTNFILAYVYESSWDFGHVERTIVALVWPVSLLFLLCFRWPAELAEGLHDYVERRAEVQRQERSEAKRLRDIELREREVELRRAEIEVERFLKEST